MIYYQNKKQTETEELIKVFNDKVEGFKVEWNEDYHDYIAAVKAAKKEAADKRAEERKKAKKADKKGKHHIKKQVHTKHINKDNYDIGLDIVQLNAPDTPKDPEDPELSVETITEQPTAPGMIDN